MNEPALLSQLTAKDVFYALKFHLHPVKEMAIDSFLNMILREDDSGGQKVICGGIGSHYQSFHEKLFAWLYPHLKQQVVFGTGKGGREKYLTCKYVVDFWDKENKLIYEIDGSRHKSELQKTKDKIRDCFFYIEHGIRTIRYTNRDIENMVMRFLTKLENENKLKELVNPYVS